MFIEIGENVKAHHTVRSYGRNSIGHDSIILDNVLIGVPSTDLLLSLRQVDLNLEHADYEGARIANNAIIRSDAVIYCNVTIDHHVRTGHKILVRENTRVGHNVLIGTNVVIDNNCTIGSHVSIQSCVYIPTGTVIGDYVFLGPCVNLTNDMYPVRTGEPMVPVIVERGASLGANCTVLPGVRVGEGAMIAAGAVVTQDVPPWHLAVGVPAKFRPLPEKMRVLNKIV